MDHCTLNMASISEHEIVFERPPKPKQPHHGAAASSGSGGASETRAENERAGALDDEDDWLGGLLEDLIFNGEDQEVSLEGEGDLDDVEDVMLDDGGGEVIEGTEEAAGEIAMESPHRVLAH